MPAELRFGCIGTTLPGLRPSRQARLRKSTIELRLPPSLWRADKYRTVRSLLARRRPSHPPVLRAEADVCGASSG